MGGGRYHRIRGARVESSGFDGRNDRAGEPRPVVFLFSGQGSQYRAMGRGLYAQEPIFREQVDRCAGALASLIGMDIRSALFEEEPSTDPERLNRTAVTQPALFVLEYALAKLWMSLDVHPQGMIGHSIGEYVAACLAGVFSLDDALRLVAARGQLMQSMPPGSMLAVSMTEAEATSLLREDVDLAAVNAPNQCVLSGSEPSIRNLQETLANKGIHSSASLTFHSRDGSHIGILPRAGRERGAPCADASLDFQRDGRLDRARPNRGPIVLDESSASDRPLCRRHRNAVREAGADSA